MSLPKDPIKKAEYLAKLSAALTKRFEDPAAREKISTIMKGRIPWNKDLTKETDPRVAKQGAATAAGMKGKKHVMTQKKYPKISASMTGKKNAYIDGRSKLPYDPEWTEEFRESIRARDKVCQLCGKTKEQNCKDGRALAVHHCRYGRITENDIFVALCASCNGKVNKRAEKDYWTKFFVARMVLAA